MEVSSHWHLVKKIFKQSFSSSFHYSIASIDEKGKPHVTPIGSLILTRPGEGFYFEKFTRKLPANVNKNPDICVLAVNSSKWFWLRSLISGSFLYPPAIRLHGTAGELRAASQHEIKLWQKKVRSMRFTKGHKLMWSEMARVRTLNFTKIEPVNIGSMTK